jgi:hypothetical protein
VIYAGTKEVPELFGADNVCLLLLCLLQQPPKKKDKEPEETLTRIAIVNEDR